MAITDPKDQQKAQEPSARNGDNQGERVPTHEGSQLGSPTTAGETTKAMPKDSEAQS